MKDVILIVEGGGNRLLNIELREAFDGFVGTAKARVRSARRRWQTIPGGGRDDAYKEFLDVAGKNPDSLVLLLVDSEGPLDGLPSEWSSRKKDRRVFFMVQCMEAWIVADGERLGERLGGRFRPEALPKRSPEECSPEDLRRTLGIATQDCGIGRYGKKHGPRLLAMVRPEDVAVRCGSAKDFLRGLEALIG